jgi:hypothetical protein
VRASYVLPVQKKEPVCVQRQAAAVIPILTALLLPLKMNLPQVLLSMTKSRSQTWELYAGKQHQNTPAQTLLVHQQLQILTKALLLVKLNNH